jgi:hypothetical protein
MLSSLLRLVEFPRGLVNHDFAHGKPKWPYQPWMLKYILWKGGIMCVPSFPLAFYDRYWESSLAFPNACLPSGSCNSTSTDLADDFLDVLLAVHHGTLVHARHIHSQPQHLPPSASSGNLRLPRRLGHVLTHCDSRDCWPSNLPLNDSHLHGRIQYPDWASLRHSSACPAHESHCRCSHLEAIDRRGNSSSRSLRCKLHILLQCYWASHPLHCSHPHSSGERYSGRRGFESDHFCGDQDSCASFMDGPNVDR